MTYFAVIMAGGLGERLWPLSRRETPKQFLRLLGERTLLQQTVERIAPLVRNENTYVVVGREQVGIVREQLPELPTENVIVEPMGRGTAPCIGLAASRLAHTNSGSHNKRAQRAYEKAGFTHEGTKRESYFRGDRYYDTLIMGILRSEWREDGTTNLER